MGIDRALDAAILWCGGNNGGERFDGPAGPGYTNFTDSFPQYIYTPDNLKTMADDVPGDAGASGEWNNQTVYELYEACLLNENRVSGYTIVCRDGNQYNADRGVNTTSSNSTSSSNSSSSSNTSTGTSPTGPGSNNSSSTETDASKPGNSAPGRRFGLAGTLAILGTAALAIATL
jgi:hypothetical protein